MASLIEIQRAIRALPPERQAFEARPTHAAVAMIFGDGPEGLELCFIRRAERAGDPWSGQVAFPGGRASADDADAGAVAERETWEEIGLRLARQQCIGGLPMRAVQANTLRAGLSLWPFLYYVGDAGHPVATPRIPEEVASVFWVPINHLFDVNAVTEIIYPPTSGASFPGIKFDRHVIWGLTLRVLKNFADILGREFPALD